MVFKLLSLFPSLWTLDRSRPVRPVDQLYAAMVDQARAPGFYTDFGVADTVDGRFELLSLHAYLLMRRLRDGGDPGFSQALFDLMFQDMDDSLRELGVGDTRIPKKVRALAEDFFGRVTAFDTAFAAEDPEAALAHALSRNVFDADDAPGAPGLAAYVTAATTALATQSVDQIEAGAVSFPPVPLTED